MAKIIRFPRSDGPDAGYEDIPPNTLLQYAIDRDQLAACIVAGITKDDQPFLSSTTSDIGYAIYLLERAKRHLLELVEETRRLPERE